VPAARRHVLLTRPQADSAALAPAIEALGYAVLIEPLLAIEPVADGPLDLVGVQAIALTSANAVPALDLAALALPVFAVGAATAAAARRAGARHVEIASGDAVGLARLVIEKCLPKRGAILHLAGTEIRPGLAEILAPAGFELRRELAYRVVPATALGPAVVNLWRRRRIAAVLLFSPRSAQILIDLLHRHELAGRVDSLAALCLSEAVAAPCRALAWRAIRVAASPDRAALLALLQGG
jgi:uroporphyrinogen-III synthase